ncbi:MAG: hypothetical protein JWR84_1868 [Caulobacter sp.]|nr:hypothetical protein [Caulobacter sp.]
MSDDTPKSGMRSILRRPKPAPAEAPEAQVETVAKRGVSVRIADRGVLLFFVCLVVGLLLASTGLSANPVLQQIGLLGPIVATIAFPLLGLAFRLGSDAHTRERFADNCYYLGFIFTQAALLFGFLPVAISSREISSGDVLRFFGVAIGASMAGLIARTLLIQTARTTSELDNAIHTEVEALAVAVSDRSRRVFEQFSTLGQELGAAHEALNKQLQNHMAVIAGSMSDYEALLKREVASLASGAAQVSQSADRAERDFDSHQRTFGLEVKRAADILQSLQTELSTQVAGASAAIRSSADSLATGARALQGLSGLGGSVESLQARVSDIDTATQTLDSTVQRATGLLERTTSEVVHELGGAADRAGEALNVAVGKAAGQLSDSFARSTGELDHSAREARGHLGDRATAFNADIQGAVEALRETLTSFRAEIERIRVEPAVVAQKGPRGRRGKDLPDG